MRAHRVLRAPFGPEVLEDVVAALVDVDPEPASIGLAGDDESHVGHVYLLRRGLVRLTAVQDSAARAWYLVVESPDDAVGREVDAALRGALPVRTSEELVDDAERDLEDGAALLRMSIGAADDADPRVLAVLQAALGDDDADLRSTAVEAATLTGWPEVAELLVRVRDEDPEPDLREYAATALDLLGAG